MRRSSGPEPRNRAVTVKLSGSEKTAIEAAAARRHLSLSGYIAEVALAAAEGRMVPVRVRQDRHRDQGPARELAAGGSG